MWVLEHMVDPFFSWHKPVHKDFLLFEIFRFADCTGSFKDRLHDYGNKNHHGSICSPLSRIPVRSIDSLTFYEKQIMAWRYRFRSVICTVFTRTPCTWSLPNQKQAKVLMAKWPTAVYVFFNNFLFGSQHIRLQISFFLATFTGHSDGSISNKLFLICDNCSIRINW